jgi:hypothetical protein
MFLVSVLLTPDVAGHEISIYRGYSLYTWIGLCVAGTGGVLAIITEALFDTQRTYWKRAAGVLTLAIIVYLFLPTIHGYFLYGRGSADILVHFAFIKEIARTGHLTPRNWYPALHLLLYPMRALGASYSAAASSVAALFFILYVLSMYVLARTLAGRRSQVLMIFALAFIPYFMNYHRTLHPFILSFMMVPLVYAVSIRYKATGQRRFGLLFVGLVFLFIVFHPVSSVFLFVFLVVSAVVREVVVRLDSLDGASSWVHTKRTVYTVVSAGISLVAWYFSFDRITSPFIQIFSFLGQSSGAVTIAQRQAQAVGSGLTTLQLVSRFIDLYGPIFALCVSAAVAGLYVGRELLQKRVDGNNAVAVAQFGTGAVIAVGMIFVDFIASDPVRVSRYMIVGAVLAVGLVIPRVFQQRAATDRRHLADAIPYLLIALVVLSVPIAMTGVYRPNNHLTATEYHGTEWTADHRPAEAIVTSYRTDPKTVEFIKGSLVEPDIKYMLDTESSLPRLGYNKYESAATGLSERRPYLLTKTHDTEFHRPFFRSQWQNKIQYTRSDLRRLQQDGEMNRLYNNGGLSLWKRLPRGEGYYGSDRY